MVIGSDALPAAGTFLLGLFIGYLVRYFVVRLLTFSVAMLAVIIAAVLGGSIAGFLLIDQVGQSVRWWYPIGIIVGWMVNAVIAWLADVIHQRRDRL
jgi:hypothetical protein